MGRGGRDRRRSRSSRRRFTLLSGSTRGTVNRRARPLAQSFWSQIIAPMGLRSCFQKVASQESARRGQERERARSRNGARRRPPPPPPPLLIDARPAGSPLFTFCLVRSLVALAFFLTAIGCQQTATIVLPREEQKAKREREVGGEASLSLSFLTPIKIKAASRGESSSPPPRGVAAARRGSSCAHDPAWLVYVPPW